MKKNKKNNFIFAFMSPLLPIISIAAFASNNEFVSSFIESKNNTKNSTTKRIELVNTDSVFNYTYSNRVMQNTELRFYYSDAQWDVIPINTTTGLYSIDNYCVQVKNGIVKYPLSADVIDTHWGDSGWAVGPKFWDSSFYTTEYGPDYSYHMANKEIVAVNINNYTKIFKESLAASFSGKHDGVYRYRVTQFNHGNTQMNPFNYFLFNENGSGWKSLADVASSNLYGGALYSDFSYNSFKSFSSLTQLKTNMLAPYNPSATTGEFDFAIYDKEIYLAGSQSQIGSISTISDLYTKYDVNSFYNELNSPETLSKFFKINLIDCPKAVISDYRGQKSYVDITKDDTRQVIILKFVTANSLLAPSTIGRDQGTSGNTSYEITDTEWIKDSSISSVIELPFSNFTTLVTTDVTPYVKQSGISISGNLSSKLASEVISAPANSTLYNDLKRWISDNSNIIFVGYPTEKVPVENIISISMSGISGTYNSIRVGVTIKDAVVQNVPTQSFFEFNITGFLTLSTDLSAKDINIPTLSSIPLSQEYISQNMTTINDEIKKSISNLNINLPPGTEISIDLSNASYEKTVYGILNNVTVNLSKHYDGSGSILGSASFVANIGGFAQINPTASLNAFAKYPISFPQNIETIDEQTIKNIILNSDSIFNYNKFFPLKNSDIINIDYSINKKIGEVTIKFISYKTYNDKGQYDLVLENQSASISIVGFEPFIPWYEEYFYLLLGGGITLFFLIIILIIVLVNRNKKSRNKFISLNTLPRNRLPGGPTTSGYISYQNTQNQPKLPTTKNTMHSNMSGQINNRTIPGQPITTTDRRYSNSPKPKF